MGYRIRQIEPDSQFCNEITLEIIREYVPVDLVEEVIEECGVKEARSRKLPALLVVWLCIGMNLFCQMSMRYVLVKLVQGIRLLHALGVAEVAGKSSISEARYKVGAKPLEMLFKRVCRPLATPDTCGAFAFGLRLVAVDGTTEIIPDTPKNSRYFGRAKGQRGDSAFPQVQCVYLCECGTHAIFDAGFWPYAVSERVGGHRLLRSIEADMLVMWDRGFHDFDMFLGVVERGAQVLSRLPAHVKPERVRTLPDGSWLGYIYPATASGGRAGNVCWCESLSITWTTPTAPAMVNIIA